MMFRVVVAAGNQTGSAGIKEGLTVELCADFIAAACFPAC